MGRGGGAKGAGAGPRRRSPCSFSRMLPFPELSWISAADREKMSVAWGSSSCRCLWSSATLLEFCRRHSAGQTGLVYRARPDRQRRYLSDGVDVAVGQQLLLQGAQQLVQVSRLAAVRRRGALLQLVAVLLQFAQRLVLQRTENRTAVTRQVPPFSLHSQRGGLPGRLLRVGGRNSKLNATFCRDRATPCWKNIPGQDFRTQNVPGRHFKPNNVPEQLWIHRRTEPGSLRCTIIGLEEHVNKHLHAFLSSTSLNATADIYRFFWKA